MSFLQYTSSELSSLLGSAKHRYQGLSEFAGNFPRQASDLVVNLGGHVRDELVRRIDQEELPIRTPVRAGRLKGSKRVRRGSAPTEMSSITFDAQHAAVLERGRKRSKPYSRRLRGASAETKRGRRGRLLGAAGTKPFTRMLGSRKAPRGYLRVSWRAVYKNREAVLAKAYALAEAGS